MIKKSKQTVALGMIGTIALILTTSVLVAPLTSWLISINRSVGESNSKLEAVTVSQSEWERLQHMSLNELRSNKTALATPYNVGDGFQVKVNLGAEGYFSGGKCGNIPSGKNANCFKDTTITVFNDSGDRLFSSRQLPLQVGLYTTEEIDSKFTAESTARGNKDNNLQTQINNLSSKFGNYYTKPEIDSKLKKLEEESGGKTFKDTLSVSSQALTYYSENWGQTMCSGGSISANITRTYLLDGIAVSSRTLWSKSGDPLESASTTQSGHSISIVFNRNNYMDPSTKSHSLYVDGSEAKRFPLCSASSYNSVLAQGKGWK